MDVSPVSDIKIKSVKVPPTSMPSLCFMVLEFQGLGLAL